MADFKFINNGENKIYNLSEEEILKAEDRMGIRFLDDLRELYLEVDMGSLKSQVIMQSIELWDQER